MDLSLMLRKAFILFGGIAAAKHPHFIHYLYERKFSILVIDDKTERSRVRLAFRNDSKQHVLNKIQEIVLIEPEDLNEIFKQVNIWQSKYTISGVCTIREHFVSPAGVIADFLNLPGPGLRASNICRNKFLQRMYLDKWSPDFQILNSAIKDINFGFFPAVLKPIARQGSSGIVLVNSVEEVVNELPSYDSDESLLIENFIVGNEYTVESLIQNGEIIYTNASLTITNHVYSKQFVELAHTLPAPQIPESLLNRLYEINSDVVRRLIFQDGVSHGEYKITADGEIFLMEIAARHPGGGIMQLYHLATGKPLEEQIIKIALGEAANYPKPTRIARQVYFEHPTGRLIDVVLEGFSIKPHFFLDIGMCANLDYSAKHEAVTLRELTIEKQRGELLCKVRQSRDRCGYFLMDGVNIDELDKLEKKVLKRLKIIVEPVL